jgi:5-methyltetrahydrofolate--homocysteine methyltransferase
MKTTLQDLLASGKPIIADGAMGSNLIELGLGVSEPTAVWNVDNPEMVRKVHRSFIEAGAQIILSNTFVCNRLSLKMHGMEDRATEFTQAAVQNARAEADAAAMPVVVGGSIGPTGDILEPLGTLTFEEARDVFEEQAKVMAAGGIDVFWIETMSDVEEVRAAMEGCRRADPNLPIVTTMSFERGGRTMMGVTPQQAVETFKQFGPVAIGGNCGSSLDEIRTVIKEMHAADPDVVIIAKANAGLPHLEENDVTVYDATPEDMATYARDVYNGGASIIGACCGSRPEHLSAIVQALQEV